MMTFWNLHFIQKDHDIIIPLCFDNFGFSEYNIGLRKMGTLSHEITHLFPFRIQLLNLLIWARLFKTNNIVSYHFVKISNVLNISNMPTFFVEKSEKLLHIAKASLVFSTKNISVFGYKVVKHLMS